VSPDGTDRCGHVPQIAVTSQVYGCSYLTRSLIYLITQLCISYYTIMYILLHNYLVRKKLIQVIVRYDRTQVPPRKPRVGAHPAKGPGSCVTGVTYSTVVQVACTRPSSSLKNML
jgi:hypothetical protein